MSTGLMLVHDGPGGVCSISSVDMSTGTLKLGQGYETFSCHKLHFCQVWPTKQIPV